MWPAMRIRRLFWAAGQNGDCRRTAFPQSREEHRGAMPQGRTRRRRIPKDGRVVSPEEIRPRLIPIVGGNSKIVPVRENAIEGWKEIWGAGRTGRICEDMGPCANTAGYHNGKCFYGSSTYDTAQMPRLIDLLIGECREQGIETKTPAELAALMEEWEKRGES